MSLTRKMLKAMGIEEEKIDQIIEAHTDVTDSLKADRDKYKADAERSYDLERQLEEAHEERDKALEKANETKDDPYKEKYESEKQAFADYKKSIEAEQTKAKKVTAYRELLKKAGVSEKRIDSVIKVTAIDDIELDADGAIKNADEKEKAIKDEWSDFIPKMHDEGADTETPPDASGAKSDGQLSRAAQRVAAHNERLYGVKGENK